MKRSVGLWSASVVATAVLVSAQSALGELIGASEFLISVTPGAWFPDVAYDSVDGKYLVVWPDYGNSPIRIVGRFVTSGGAVSGAPFFISDASGGLFPAIAYGAVNNEFLVTWDDQRPGFAIWGQRIRASDGALLGSNFQISQTEGIRSAIAWNAGSNVYLVTWWGGGPSEISGRRVSGTGSLLGSQLNISNDPYFDGYPAVSSDNGSQFLVSWDFSSGDNIGYIYAQRVNSATGNNTGAVIPVSLSGNRSCIAYDSGNSRWLVQFNQSNPGQSYDQFGQLVNAAGALVGGSIAIANTTGFEGDTQFGGDVAFTPLGRFFSSFGTDTGMGGRELLASNSLLLTPQTVVLGTGSYTSVNNAADTTLNRFLTVWDGTAPSSGHYVWGRLYEPTDLIAPAPVTALTATPGSRLIHLNWTNPVTADFTGTMIRSKLGSAPTGPFDGQLVVDQSNTPGSSATYIHAGLTAGTTYYYAAFAHDAHPNYSTGVTTSAIPAAYGDFDADGDVDLSDFAHLQNCLSGDAHAYATGCADVDFDLDGDVDSNEVNAFLPCLSGPDLPPGC